MRHLIPLALLALTSTLPLHAQTPPADHHNHASPPAASSPAPADESALPWAQAEVRRIDTVTGKITLRHGDIPNLDMPPMTMVFQMRDPSQLGSVRVGDRVRFTALQIHGAYTVQSLEPVR